MAFLQWVPDPSRDPADPHGFDKVSVVARKDERLSDRAYRMLACLEGYCWGDDRESWPSNRTLGKASGGRSANSVRLALRELEQLQYIRIEPDERKMRGQRIVLLYLLKRPAGPL